jgi:hypothetical protein
MEGLVSKEAHSHRTCFDRVIPANLDPNALARQAALSKYVSTVKAAKKAPPDAPFREHVAAIGSLGEKHATDPITVARMAVINAW